MASELFPKWKVTGVGSLLWEQWENEYAVFHPPSGKTHFLNASSALILHFIYDEASDVERIAAEIGVHSGVPVDDALMQQVRHALLRFEQLGLVSRDHGLDPVTP